MDIFILKDNGSKSDRATDWIDIGCYRKDSNPTVYIFNGKKVSWEYYHAQYGKAEKTTQATA